MKRLNMLLLMISFIIISIIIQPKIAHAYLDPGTGSYIIQLALAGLLGSLFFVKTMWSRIKTFFAGLFSKENKE